MAKKKKAKKPVRKAAKKKSAPKPDANQIAARIVDRISGS